MEEEILTGGRVTAQVVRRGEFVHRTPCKNAAFVHQVLEFLEAGGVEGVPRCRRRPIHAANKKRLDQRSGRFCRNRS